MEIDRKSRFPVYHLSSGGADGTADGAFDPAGNIMLAHTP